MKRNQVIIVVVVVALFGLLMAGCLAIVGGVVFLRSEGSEERIVTEEEAGFADATEWEQSGMDPFVEIDLPPSARHIRFLSGGFQDPYYLLRATIDPGDLDVVASADGCGGLLTQAESRQPQSFGESEWWSVDSATIYQSCAGYSEPGYEQNVFVDQSDSNEYFIYVSGVSF